MAKAKVTVFAREARKSARFASVPKRRDIAEQIVELARVAAPRRSGRYADSMTVHVDGSQVFAVDEDHTAIHKEYGTSDTPAHAALTNAAVHFGRYRGMKPR